MRSNCLSDVTVDLMALFQVVIWPSGLPVYFPLAALYVLIQLWVTHRSSPDYKSVAAQQRSI
jgi:membrane protein insertase Oxa1/YidC/SpoIIIJ